MTDHAHAAERAKTHTIYRLSDGTRVPGVTTILGDTIPKPALVQWANKLGLQGIETRKYVDELATIGTLAHYLIECTLSNKEPDLKDYSPNQIALAYNSYRKFEEWVKKVDIEVIMSEQASVSEVHRYGGTIDAYLIVDGRPTLLDIKTSKVCYPDHYTQIAAYALLIEEDITIPSPEVHKILRVGRNEDEGFEEITIKNINLHKERFLLCRALYDINRKVAKAIS